MRGVISSLWRSISLNSRGSYSGRRYAHMADFKSGPTDGRQLVRIQKERRELNLDPTMWSPLKVPKAAEVTDQLRHEDLCQKIIGGNISSREKSKLLIDVLHGLDNSKEAVYGALDAWVAWETKFPISRLKNALHSLKIGGHWHRIIQVIKWMLSKGQGKTMGTYEQLIQALDKDNRAEEAHNIWVQKISHDLHPVPWPVCELMISIYYRNNMLERLVKLFKDLESFDRKIRNKMVVRKVSDAYEMLGLLEEKEKVSKKYDFLFKEVKILSTKKRKLKQLEAGKIASKASENDLVADRSTNGAAAVSSG